MQEPAHNGAINQVIDVAAPDCQALRFQRDSDRQTVGDRDQVLVGLTLMTRSLVPGLDRVWLHVAVVAVLLCVAPFLIFA